MGDGGESFRAFVPSGVGIAGRFALLGEGDRGRGLRRDVESEQVALAFCLFCFSPYLKKKKLYICAA